MKRTEPQRVTVITEALPDLVNELRAGDHLRVYRRSVTEVRPGLYRVELELGRINKR